MKITRGSKLGGYRILERLGTTVFLVERDGRRATLRVLPETSADLVARCFTIACLAGNLPHAAFAHVIDVGYTSRPYIVTELLDGESLERRLARGPLPLSQALVLAHRIAHALAASHAQHLAHGALEPRSIFLVDDQIKLVGFGLAALGGGDAMNTVDTLAAPVYMSPEQCRASTAYDARSDLYALGCILHEMITGTPPFASDRFGELLTSHLMATPPPLPSTVPAAVRDLVAALLAKNPDDRPSSAAYVAALLDGTLADLDAAARPAKPWRWVAAFAIAAFATISTAYGARQEFSKKMQVVFHDFDLPSLPL